MVLANRSKKGTGKRISVIIRLAICLTFLTGYLCPGFVRAAELKTIGPGSESAQGDDDWRLFRGDARASGVARGSLPEKLGVVWTFTLEKGWFESAAVIADGTVYIGSTDGKLYALGLKDGKKKWDFETDLGFTAAAAVRDAAVFAGDCDGRFYCLDAATGKLRWHFDAEAEINGGPNFHRDRVLFGSQDGFLYCLDAKTGKTVWKYESQDQIRCFPTVVEDRAFVAGCDGRLHVIDLERGVAVADVELDGPTGSSPAVLGTMVFVGTEGNSFFAINWQKAETVWTYQGGERRMPFRGSAAVTEDLVVVGSLDKSVHAIDPDSGRGLWKFATKGRVESSPVIVGNRVLVGSSDGRLYSLDRKTGKQLWRFDAGGGLIAAPAVAGGYLVIGNDDGQLYCFGAQGGG
jgi:eukaryotic-like serine/threonine-protein kinase